jgi:transposase-like protein
MRTAALRWTRRAPLPQDVAAPLPRRERVPRRSGENLFTFLRFPPSQWKALRTTNALERINEEFWRRTKTQANLPGQDAVLLQLFGLLRTGQVKLRKMDCWQEMGSMKRAAWALDRHDRQDSINPDSTPSPGRPQRGAVVSPVRVFR